MIRCEIARKGNTITYHKRLRPSQANQKTLNEFWNVTPWSLAVGRYSMNHARTLNFDKRWPLKTNCAANGQVNQIVRIQGLQSYALLLWPALFFLFLPAQMSFACAENLATPRKEIRTCLFFHHSIAILRKAKPWCLFFIASAKQSSFSCLQAQAIQYCTRI